MREALLRDLRQAFSLNGRKTQKGFTLVELLVVIAIIAIIASLAIPSFIKYQQKSKVSSYAEPYARACLMDLITYCMEHPGSSVNSTLLENLTNCKKLIGFNVATPDGTNYAVFAPYTTQTDIAEDISWSQTTTGSTASGGSSTTTYTESYSIYVDDLSCDTSGHLVDNNGDVVDVTTRLVYDDNNRTVQVGPYFAECSYYQDKGIKCIITDNPKNN